MTHSITQNIESVTVTGLPPREGAVLGYTALGLSSKHIAKKLHCSPRNVENLKDSARTRLHASNTPNLIALAFQKGILKFLSLALVITGTTLTTLPQIAKADDDEPVARRLRHRGHRRGSRRVTRGLYPPAAINQLYIEYFNLCPVLSWDDGCMFIQYEPATVTQSQPYAQVFNLEDLMRWHSEQFYQSLERDAGGQYGQTSEDQHRSQAAEGSTHGAAQKDARHRSPGSQ